MSIFDRFKKTNEAPQKASVAKQVNATAEDVTVVAEAEAPKTKGKKAAAAKAPAARAMSSFASSTILAPIVSEKTAHLSDEDVMVFRVPTSANRIMVRQAVKELYKVSPLWVNIINVRGKTVRFGGREGRQSDIKKAIVKLPKGVRIDVFEGV